MFIFSGLFFERITKICEKKSVKEGKSSTFKRKLKKPPQKTSKQTTTTTKKHGKRTKTTNNNKQKDNQEEQNEIYEGSDENKEPENEFGEEKNKL